MTGWPMRLARQSSRRGRPRLGTLPSRLCGLPTAIAAAYRPGMSLPPDQPPSPKPKLSAEEHRARQADRLKCIPLRRAIGRELEERGITTPAAIGEALGMSAPEASKLLARHRSH